MAGNVRHFLDIDDLTDDEIDWVIAGPHPDCTAVSGSVIGLIFLESSLRTHFGFAAAALRLGASPLSVTELRQGEGMPRPESLADTLRAVGGMADLVVVRPGQPLDREGIRSTSPVPVINGGDPSGEHPTQALIDFFALEKFVGPIQEIRLGICGDLTMRASRSLLRLLNRRPPRSLRMIAPHSRANHGISFSEELEKCATLTELSDFSDLDALIITGITPLTDGDRFSYTLTKQSAGSLPHHAVVLSPMPLIDDISSEMLRDPRVRVYDQSDLGVAVRMAVLQLLLKFRQGQGR